MKTKIRIFLLTLIAATAAGQELLTLDHAIDIALEQNQNLRAARFDVESSRWGTKNAYSNFLPKIEISGGVTRIDPETERRANATLDFIRETAGIFGIPPSLLSEIKPFAYRDTYVSEITVLQPLYNGGAELVGVSAANATSERSEFSLQDTEQDVIVRVKTSYYDVLKAQALVIVAKESAERTRRNLEVISRRAAVGTRTQTDVLRWEVQLAADEGGIINVENLLAAARLKLNEVLGVDLHKVYTLEKVVPPDSVFSTGQGTALLSREPLAGAAPEYYVMNAAFLETHPGMRMMEANLRLAEVNIDRSWVNFKPRVNLAFQYGWERNNTLGLDGIKPWALALSVSLPVFNGFGDYTNLERAHADYNRTEVQVESFRRMLLLQATSAELNVNAARKRIEIARKGQQQALEVLNSVSRRYETGGASNVDLIDVQTAYTSAKTSLITAMYDYYTAQLQLARATGKVSR